MTMFFMIAAALTLVGCGKQPSGAYDTRYGAGTNGANAAGDST